jgi:hypothetical protein
MCFKKERLKSMIKASKSYEPLKLNLSPSMTEINSRCSADSKIKQ